MRRTATSLIAVTLLLLAGCSGGDDATDDPTPSTSASASAPATASAQDVAALEQVTLSGPVGAEPTIEFTQPFEVSAPVARLSDPGTGAAIEAGQLLTVNLTAVSGTDGSSQGTTWGSSPASYPLDTSTLPQVLIDAFVGQQVGARVLFAQPGDDGTMIWAFEVTGVSPTRAQGTPVTPPEGLPTVTLADDGEPSIQPLDTPAPTTLVAQTLIQGTGPAIEADDTITIQYSGWLWDGTAFDSSWKNGTPLTSPLSSLIKGWGQGLVGQQVGSQVLLVIPPDLGYGDKDQGSIPAGSTLIFVVDVLATS